MKLGDRVRCTGYVKRSGNHYEIMTGKETESGAPACAYWPAGASEGTEVEDFHACNRFVMKKANFSGVYVGTTTLCVRLNAEYEEGPYTAPCFRTYHDLPEKFAVVYYADNKKRLVPLDMVEVMR